MIPHLNPDIFLPLFILAEHNMNIHLPMPHFMELGEDFVDELVEGHWKVIGRTAYWHSQNKA